MRLVSLKLTDFLNHRDTEIGFGQITAIAGPNNAGKSAIKDAIEMALTGTARTTDKRGREAAPLVRCGAKSFWVSAKLEHSGDGPDVPGDELEVSRSKGLSGGHSLDVESKLGGAWEGSIGDKQRALYRAIGADAGVIRACIHAGELAKMDPEEQQDLLFGVLGLEFTLPRIQELLQECGCVEEDTELLYGGPEQTFLAAPARETYGPEIFDEAHTYAYEKRRQAKRDLHTVEEELTAARKRLKEEVGNQRALERMTPEKSEDMRKQLTALEVERDRLSELKGAVADLPQQLAAARAALTAAEEQIADRTAWEKHRDEVTGTLGLLKDKIGSLEGEIEVLEDTAGRTKSELEQVKKALKKFSGDKPKCPLVPGMECPLTDTARQKVLEKLEKRQTKLLGVLESTERVGEIRGVLAQYVEVRDAEPDEQDADALKELQGKVQKLEKRQGEAGDLEELEALKERISRGHGKVRLVESYLQHVDRLGEVLTRKRDREQHVESWERLVGALNPDGAKLRAVEKPLEELQERINARLKEYAAEYELAILTKDEFELSVRTPETDGGWIPIKGLSTSERLRVGLALQDAICHLSGLGFLLIDNFDMLDAENRRAVGEALREWQEEYETIVILTTRDSRPAPNDTRTTYWIEHGHVELV